jgi:4'-phosphopantetheinyl transferase
MDRDPTGDAVETPADLLAQLSHRLHVWIAEPPAGRVGWDAADLELLAADERDRHQRFRRAADRDLFLAARVLLRTTLSRYGEIEPAAWAFQSNMHGRPEIGNPDAPSGLRFNLSHTSGMIALLVHDHADGGIDVECLGRLDDFSGVARLALTEAEREGVTRLRPGQQEVAFYRLWTLKEAFAKATGRGLSLPIKDFWFTGLDEGPIRLGCRESIDPDPAAWSFTVRSPSDRHVLATAYRGGESGADREIQLRRVDLG